jgi:hypothetical protein
LPASASENIISDDDENANQSFGINSENNIKKRNERWDKSIEKVEKPKYSIN